MNDMRRLREIAKFYKEQYPAGTRIELEHMGDDPRPIAPGTRGTVRVVDSMGTVHCDFDNGRCLGLIPGADSFRKLSTKELAQEQPNSSLDDKIQSANARKNTEPAKDKVSQEKPFTSR